MRETASALARNWSDKPVHFVRNFDNAVYRISEESVPLYLRITHERHRSKAQVESELQVVRHVAGNGVVVGQPVESRLGEFVHTAGASDGDYSACVFTEAPGRAFEESRPTDEKDFFRNAGRTIGLLQEVLSDFDPSNEFVRFKWSDDRWSKFAEYVPGTEGEAWELFDELQAFTQTAPYDPPLFGLIHGDFTIANLRIDDARIAVFDFDSCCEHWRAYEIAMFLHYFGGRDEDSRKLVYDSVLEGYAQASSLPPLLVQQIPHFGRMRLLYSFLVFAIEWGFKDLSPERERYFALRRRWFREPSPWPAR